MLVLEVNQRSGKWFFMYIRYDTYYLSSNLAIVMLSEVEA